MKDLSDNPTEHEARWCLRENLFGEYEPDRSCRRSHTWYYSWALGYGNTCWCPGRNPDE